jgi:Metallo-peptidase family M12B Reprolysin-like
MKASTCITVYLYAAFIGVVQSLDLGNTTTYSIASATSCNIVGNRTKCRFSSKNLNLNVDSSIEIMVKMGGRVVNCNNTLIRESTWYGICDGDADDASFVRREYNGTEGIFGSIRVGNDICLISPGIDRTGEIICIPKKEFKAEGIALEASTKTFPKERRNLKFGYTPAWNRRTSNTALRGGYPFKNERQLYDDSGSNIDVMVVWTMEAECRNAGLSVGCALTTATEEKMRGLIDLAISESNIAFQLSGIFTAFRLVHAYRDPDYIEASSYSVALDELTFTNDGQLESVHVKRALYGADVVHMIAGAPTSCGIAWSGEPKVASMFSISQYSCSTGYYSFGHEIGHNFDLQHDRASENVCNMNSTFNYGYKNPNAEFRTILSYDCKIGQCDNMPKNGCDRILRFSNSNPSYTFNGQPIGDSTMDNARQFNSKRSFVASMYPAMNCQSNIECDDGDSNTNDTCNVVTGVCIFSAPKQTTIAPVSAPVIGGVAAKPTFYLESIKVTGVNSTNWKAVQLTKQYVSPIPVCTVKYDLGTTLLPAVARIRNIASGSFQIRLQNPSEAILGSRDVHCIVVEEGVWKMPDGRSLEAKKYSSTVTDNTMSWNGQRQTYQNKYTNPVVLGQVISFNDPKWSVFWSRSTLSKNNAPTSAGLITGKHVGEDPKTTRVDETVGYIVIEAARAMSGSVDIETGRGPDSFTAYTGTKYSQKFTKAFIVKPVVAVVCQAGMDDVDGSWAVLTSDPTTTAIAASIDEDQIADTERVHTSEEIAYVVFSAEASIPLTLANCKSDTDCQDGNDATYDTCNTLTKVCTFTPIVVATITATKRPTSAPITTTKAPTSTPTKLPTLAPTKKPTSVPTSSPTTTPTKLPTSAPIAKTKAPTLAPTKRPTSAPITKAPSKAPTKQPTAAPITKTVITSAPVAVAKIQAPVTPQLPFMESIKVTGVNSSVWKVVQLTQLYISPIPVCTVKYDLGVTLIPAIARIRNIANNSFQLRIQNPSEAVLGNRDVHCVVVEEGAWKMPDGRSIEAKKYSSTVTDNTKSWTGQQQIYMNKYTNPVVLGQVISFNDPKWSVFWSRSTLSKNNAPTATGLFTGKHVGEDPKTTRVAETVGYIVIEAVHANSGSVEIETGRGADSFTAYTGTKYSLAFTKAFATKPVVAIVCQAGMDDVDGSWAVLTSDPTTTAVGVSVDEDQTLDAERGHTTEEIAYAVFSAAASIQLFKI